VIERDYRQCFFGRSGNCGLEERDLLFSREPLAYVIVSDDRSFRTELSVAARMVAMPVRVEDKAKLSLVDSFKCSADLVSQGRKLIVNDEYAVCTNRNADISARSHEHVNIAGDLRCLHFDFREIGLSSSADSN
jgi:hypothetical protein